MLKGYRTILLNALIAGSVPALQYLASVDWVSTLGPTWSMVAVAAINVVMRFVTTTPVGQAE